MAFQDKENIIQVKGRKEGLVFNFNTNLADFKELCESLEEKLLSGGDFFNKATYILQPSTPFTEGEERIIDEIMSAYQMEKTDIESAKPENEGDEDLAPRIITGVEDDIFYVQPHNCTTVLLKRGLRSGNQVSVRGNVVVFGDVNMGAELKASGNIVIMGSCRGVVHAGAEGDGSASIIAYRFNAQQIRIAEVSAVVAVDCQEDRIMPQRAVLEGDTIFLADYESNPIRKIV